LSTKILDRIGTPLFANSFEKFLSLLKGNIFLKFHLLTCENLFLVIQCQKKGVLSMSAREKTNSQRLAQAKYNAENYDRVAILVKKGKRDEWKKAAAERNIAYAELIRRGADEYIQNHPIKEE